MTNLHGPIDLTAVKHQVEVVQVAAGSGPGHVLCLVDQELGGPQGQRCVLHLCPGKKNTFIMMNSLPFKSGTLVMTV